MMHSLLFFMVGLVCANGLAGQTIYLTKIAGGVWYGPSRTLYHPLPEGAAEVGTGYLRTGNDGSFYGSVGTGSEFRLGPGSEIYIGGMQRCLPCGMDQALVLKLVQGKLTTYDIAGARGYEVNVPGGLICTEFSLTVTCLHGAEAHIYVARGEITVFPRAGLYRKDGLRLMARPNVAMLSDNGELTIVSLMSAAPGVSNCLLSGASPEIAEFLQEGSALKEHSSPPFPPPIIRFPVSPTR